MLAGFVHSCHIIFCLWCIDVCKLGAAKWAAPSRLSPSKSGAETGRRANLGVWAQTLRPPFLLVSWQVGPPLLLLFSF
jgi:hypothetical protein